MLSIKAKFLLITKAMYFSNPFGMNFSFTSDLPIFYMIIWLSQPLKLWNITEIFLVNLRLILQPEWVEPLYFPLIWSWSLTFLSSLVNNILHIQH